MMEFKESNIINYSKFFDFSRDSMSNAHNKLFLHTKQFNENLHFKTEDNKCLSIMMKKKGQIK